MKVGKCHHPEAQTHLLGSKLLHAKGGAQQGPERRQKPPPWPVLDLQEHSQVLLDALCGQLPDLQKENVGVWGSTRLGKRTGGWEDRAMEETEAQPLSIPGHLQHRPAGGGPHRSELLH